MDLTLRSVITRDGVMSSMVQSRSSAGAPLYTFVCEVERGPDDAIGFPDDEAAIRRFSHGEEGLQVFWSSWDVF